jgi:hypothetical protein
MDQKCLQSFLKLYTSIGYFKGFLRLQNFKIWAAFLFVFSSNLQKQQVNWGKDAQKSYWKALQTMLVNVHKIIEK